MPFNGDTIKDRSLGGSESAAYYLGRELSARGHRVVMFTTTKEEGLFDGVQYCNAGTISERAPLGDAFCHYAEHTPHDVLIIQRHPMGFHRDYASKLNILQLHDIAQYRTAHLIAGGLLRTNIITTVSEFHKQQVAEVHSINPRAIHVVPNGVDPALYECKAVPRAADDNGFDMLYQSRPERGLEHLVRPGGIMERLADLPVRLSICSYDNKPPALAGYYAQLKAWADRLPNIMWLEPLKKADLARLQRSCDLLCYPTEFEEVSCITAMEAMFAGLPMLTSAHGALPETCANTGTLLLPLKDGRADEDAFVTKIRYLLEDRDNPDRDRVSLLGALAEKQRNASHRYTWVKACDVLERTCDEFFRRQARNTSAMLRHYIEHSDIIAAEDLLNERAEESLDAIGKVALDEITDMYDYSRKGDEEYIEHYVAMEGEALDDFGGRDAIVDNALEVVRAETRYKGVRAFVGEAQAKGAKRVLDFGCSFGSMAICLAQDFPSMEFVAVDIVQTWIDCGVAAVEKHNIANLRFERRTIDELGPLAKFDVIIAAEVLEHVRDVRGTIEKLRGSLQPEGMLITTTPYGPWELQGNRETLKRWRAHLHHFERTDLRELFGGHDPKILCAPHAQRSDTNLALGSWVVGVTLKQGKPIGEIDYKRKHRTQAPRQTVSLCIIAKDAESTIRKAVTSVADHVDEIVIGIDPATKDRTREVLANLQEQYPFKAWDVFTGIRALEEGFDAARNLTVERANGQWIMWMDADEEVPISSNIARLLRESSPDAWAMKQVHYSTMPPQVLTTDVPARLFRKDRGIRFYGVVHEHPEQTLGKAVEHTNVCDDVMFAHYGYIDERTRRKRYNRNLPLLVRDLKKHPNRLLNKFLYLRDIAQGLGFEFEQGIQPPDAERRALKGCELFEELVETAPAVRMIVDSMQFYSICNEILGRGFDVTIDMSSSKPGVPELSSKQNIRARFHSREVYLAVLNRLVKETTKHYDSRYA
jgi:2-polyprenyl-3-methyl-5-hydroxy-6-metoxy-1,4-benzoquinol methylase/glycosyltransferase involved in cell wall biosynthesis